MRLHIGKDIRQRADAQQLMQRDRQVMFAVLLCR
jgi:hypothetical protein